VLTERDAVEVVGSNQVTGLKVKQRKTGTVEELAVGGIFEEIGYEPATGFLQGVIQLNQAHEVVIDTLNQTSAPGIFAAGDITTVPEKQIVVAAGEGAKAALQAYAYLMRNTAT
jgi:alkyl hydroperoxide reductase subunit F